MEQWEGAPQPESAAMAENKRTTQAVIIIIALAVLIFWK